MATCVVYFSRQGNTKVVAQLVAKDLKADLIKITEDKNYNGLIGFIRGGAGASSGRLANLDQAIYKKIEKYSTIVLANPVWAGKTTPAILAVLKNVNFKGKAVYVITLQADPGFSGYEDRKAFYKNEIEAKNGELKAYFALCGAGIGKGSKPVDELKAQVAEKIKIG